MTNVMTSAQPSSSVEEREERGNGRRKRGERASGERAVPPLPLFPASTLTLCLLSSHVTDEEEPQGERAREGERGARPIER